MNGCARKEQFMLLDLFKAFVEIESSPNSDIFPSIFVFMCDNKFWVTI